MAGHELDLLVPVAQYIVTYQWHIEHQSIDRSIDRSNNQSINQMLSARPNSSQASLAIQNVIKILRKVKMQPKYTSKYCDLRQRYEATLKTGQTAYCTRLILSQRTEVHHDGELRISFNFA